MEIVHEIKGITSSEFMQMFPNHKFSKKYFTNAKLLSIIKIQGTKKFRPLYKDSIGRYYLKNNKEIYLK
nr:hypothetical protein [uncultured Flavobacterium sp.]